MGWVIVDDAILVGAETAHTALIKSPSRTANRIPRVGRATSRIAHTKVVPALGGRRCDGLGQCPVNQAGIGNDGTSSRAAGRGWRAKGSHSGRKASRRVGGNKTDLTSVDGPNRAGRGESTRNHEGNQS